MTMAIHQETIDTLNFDLQAAVDLHMTALNAHRMTVGEPAPTAHALVEQIVSQHNGEFEVVDDSRLPINHPSSLTAQVAKLSNTVINLIAELKRRGFVPKTFGNELQEHDVSHLHMHENGVPHEH
jgi:isopentenyl phosphate kinase